MPDYKPFGSWAPAMQDAPDDQGQNVLAPGQAAMLRRYMGLPPSWGEAIAANQAVQQAKPPIGAQLGDILGKVPEGYGRALGYLAAAPINMVSGLYNKVAAADEAYRNPSTSSDVYADPYAVAKDPDVPATALSLMGAGVPFAKPGTMGIAGGRIKAPAVRNPEAPLFDYSRLAEVPNVPQTDLERYVPPRGVPERTEKLAEKKNVERVNKVVEEGTKLGGREWYNTEPLREEFISERGAAGEPAYKQYMDMVAATSPRSNVGVNARNASYYYNLAQQGLPLPERVRVGNNWTIAEPLPKPYGHVAQGLHVQNAQNVLEGGGWPVLQNPKPASFSQNLQGNQRPITADTHNARLWGMVDSKGNPVDMPASTEYGFMERLQQEQARKMGLTPAQYLSMGRRRGTDRLALDG